jgi:hypothetical protein
MPYAADPATRISHNYQVPWISLDSSSADAFDGEAEAEGFEDGGEAAEFRVALFGKGAVELCWVQNCAARIVDINLAS